MANEIGEDNLLIIYSKNKKIIIKQEKYYDI